DDHGLPGVVVGAREVDRRGTDDGVGDGADVTDPRKTVDHHALWDLDGAGRFHQVPFPCEGEVQMIAEPELERVALRVGVRVKDGDGTIVLTVTRETAVVRRPGVVPHSGVRGRVV